MLDQIWTGRPVEGPSRVIREAMSTPSPSRGIGEVRGCVSRTGPRLRKLLTPVVTILIAVNVAVYLSLALAPAFGERMAAALGMTPALAIASLQVWRLITYAVVHGCAPALIQALVFLLFFGSGLEREWGSFRFAVFCCVAAALTVLIRSIPSDGVLFGGLGVTCAILGAFGLVFRHERLWLLFAEVRAAHLVLGILFILLLVNARPPANLLWLTGAAVGAGYFQVARRVERRSGSAGPRDEGRFSQIDVGE